MYIDYGFVRLRISLRGLKIRFFSAAHFKFYKLTTKLGGRLYLAFCIPVNPFRFKNRGIALCFPVLQNTHQK